MMDRSSVARNRFHSIASLARASKGGTLSRTKTTCSATVAAHVALVVIIFGLDTTFNRISYSTRGHDRHVSYPLFLILV
jgi:hypothetical protein